MKSKIKKFPTIIGIVVLVLGVFLGVYLLSNRQIFKSQAGGQSSPKDVRISNIISSSLTVSWITDSQTSGFIVWGQSQGNLSETTLETDESTKSITHSIVLSGLNPDKTYYFKINSNGTLFDNNGIPWQAITTSETTATSNQTLISGNVITSTGTPVNKALVYVNISGTLYSALTSQTGNFILQLGQSRIDRNTTLLEVFVQQDSDNISTAQIYPKSANPMPPMIIGQTHDFRNEPESKIDGNPAANLSLPGDTEKESKFIIPENSGTESLQPIVLKSLDEGETITSTNPEFIGEGPKGQTFTIKIESENPIIDDVKIASNGTWKWAVPENLTEGVHKLTISWKENGITRTLTRNFIVQAGELPAFEATPSETLATTTPTATSKATVKPTATVSAEPIPETGTTIYTLIFFTFAVLMFVFGGILWKFSNEL